MKKIKGVLIAAAFFAIISSGAGYCQTPPANTEAGVVDRANIENFQNIQNAKPSQKKEFDLKLIPQETKEISAIYNLPKFKLNNIVFKGNTVIKTSELEVQARDIVGKEITLNDLKDIAKKITALYQSKGYLTSIAYVPPQDNNTGIAEIVIMEGKVGTISIEGNKWARTSYIRKNILNENDLSSKEIFNVINLKRSLQDINQKDYLKGQVSLQRGNEPETTDIKLKLNEKLPIGLSASWDNTGRELIGIQKAGITTSIYNLTGFGDSLYANTSFASRTFGLNTGYSIPLGSYGTELKLGYSISDIELGGIYKQNNIEGRSQGFVASLIQPLYKGDRLKVYGDLTWDMRTSKTTIQKTLMENYELRVLRTGINTIFDDNSGRWISGVNVSTGLPIMGAKGSTGRGIGSGAFVKVNTNLIRVQKLPYRTLGIFRTNWQMSPNALKSVEQMQLGGMYTVRGFDEGVLLGDIGFNNSIELRHAVPLLPEKISIPYWINKKTNIKVKEKVHFAGFYDQGFARSIHNGKCGKFSNFLQSIGVGLRIYLTDNLTASFDMGFPMGKKRYDDQHGMRFHFSISADVLDGIRDIFKKQQTL
ncbi:MAG: ShlB/FhaC/HecB family hemolysin secretion/activation protein [Candidatus Gastranaerophilales bacterium]|nr:ShlB/FhaC/HecB family hemolysin secretion/activation protein [Candidatus Gastranaerophilales bacterium]